MQTERLAPIAIPPVRWCLVFGLDALLLVLLWYEYLQPRAIAFALGTLLVVFLTTSVWVRLLRRAWLTWRVKRVFGESIAHLRAPVLPWPYLVAGSFSDLLITATLFMTSSYVLAIAYGLAGLIHHGWHWGQALR